jgi:hypothetical protein
VKEAEEMHKAASKILFDAAVAKLSGRLLELRDWKLNSWEFPVLDVTFGASDPEKAFRVRFIFDEWDDLPPSVCFLTAAGDPERTVHRDPKGVINTGSHPSTGLPFVCSIGFREYHTHTSHLTDHWSNYRGKPGYDIGDLVTKLWQAWKKAVK